MEKMENGFQNLNRNGKWTETKAIWACHGYFLCNLYRIWGM